IACRSLFRANAERFVRAAPNLPGGARRALSSVGMAGAAGVPSLSPTPAKSRLSPGNWAGGTPSSGGASGGELSAGPLGTSGTHGGTMGTFDGEPLLEDDV